MTGNFCLFNSVNFLNKYLDARKWSLEKKIHRSMKLKAELKYTVNKKGKEN